MRTTLNLDPDVLDAARAIARVEQRALGAVISDLVRAGLSPTGTGEDDDDGFPVFRVTSGDPITDEMVHAALEAD